MNSILLSDTVEFDEIIEFILKVFSRFVNFLFFLVFYVRWTLYNQREI